jgi:hypothetical protein
VICLVSLQGRPLDSKYNLFVDYFFWLGVSLVVVTVLQIISRTVRPENASGHRLVPRIIITRTAPSITAFAANVDPITLSIDSSSNVPSLLYRFVSVMMFPLDILMNFDPIGRTTPSVSISDTNPRTAPSAKKINPHPTGARTVSTELM